MIEAIQNFVVSLPPLLQVALGGIISIGILFLATKIADWNEGKDEKKK